MKPIEEPIASIVAGRPAPISLRGGQLLSSRLFTKGLGFRQDEREAFHLRGLLPDKVLSIEEQVQVEWEHDQRKTDALERYIGLAALQDRNATLFYRVLADHLEDLMPIVYTPTVGLACQQFSHIMRRTRGLWITPADIDRIPSILANSPFEDVRLIVVTDNERILGLGDQGAGGMGIPVGKLALYSAAGGIHPSLTLPVSLDVGTDSQELLADPFYIGYKARRLRGGAYDDLVEAFAEGVAERWPGCVIQWEDFKGANAMRILDRFRDRIPSFNDDVQGTGAVALAGIYAAARLLGRELTDLRFVLAGAGAAGVGIVRQLRAAMRDAGADDDTIARAIAVTDSRGLVHDGRTDLDEFKQSVAAPAALAAELDAASDASGQERLARLIEALRPDVLIGTTGQPGSFDERVVGAMATATERPVIFPLSNPSSRVEGQPEDILAWTHGRAIIATGSPFEPVTWQGEERHIGQANNVFIFPGLGIGTIAAEATTITEGMFLAAARALAELVTDERLAVGALYPSVKALGGASAAVAVAVARQAIIEGVAGIAESTDLERLIDEATWRPAYVPYIKARGAIERLAG